jgi:hypothetical protein
VHKATDFSVSSVKAVLGHEVADISGSDEAVMVSVDVLESVLHVEVDALGQAVA